jgi:hypothetical protein
MEAKYRKEYKEKKLGAFGKAVKLFVKEAGTLEHEVVNFNINWPLKVW